MSTAIGRTPHDRRGWNRPSNGERGTCASCGNTTRFEERYIVARNGVPEWDPAWVCPRCGAETYVRNRTAVADHASERRYPPAGASTSRIDELRELRRVLTGIRRRAQAQQDLAIAMRGRVQPTLEQLTRSSLVSVLATNDQARWIDANGPACALTGYSRDELLTMSVMDLFTEATRFDRTWQRFLGHGHFVGACRLRQSSGCVITVECVANTNVMPGIHIGTLASRRMLQTIS